MTASGFGPAGLGTGGTINSAHGAPDPFCPDPPQHNAGKHTADAPVRGMLTGPSSGPEDMVPQANSYVALLRWLDTARPSLDPCTTVGQFLAAPGRAWTICMPGLFRRWYPTRYSSCVACRPLRRHAPCPRAGPEMGRCTRWQSKASSRIGASLEGGTL